jgi:hypothetical protein
MARARQISICYRRSDTAAHAGRLYDALCADFGKDTVFLDIGGVEPGDDFVSASASVRRSEGTRSPVRWKGDRRRPTRQLGSDHSDPQLRADLHRFLQKIESAMGKRPFLCTTSKYWNEHMDDSSGTHPLLLQRVPGVPAVIPRGWSRVSMWLEVKSLPGIDDAFTFTFDGTLEELRALANPNLPRGR